MRILSVAATVAAAVLVPVTSSGVDAEALERDGLRSPASGYASVSEVLGSSNPDGEITFESDAGVLTVLSSEPGGAVSTTDEIPRSMAASTVSCSLRVDHAHGSTHVTGTINVVAEASCTGGNVASLKLATQLIRLAPTHAEWGAPTKTALNTNWLQNNASTSCSNGPGDFRGWAMGTLVPLPGYTLVGSAVAKKYGATTGVACGAAKSADAEEQAEETLTVTFVRTDLVDE